MSSRTLGRRLWCGTLLVTVMLQALPVAFAGDPSGREIMERNFHVTKLPQMSNNHTMTLISANGRERIRKLSAVSKLQSNGIDSALLTRFQFPGDVRGTGFLQLQHHEGDDDLWVYLPGLKKIRRLVANNKKDSFFGSEFAYGDLLLPVVDTFQHTLLRQEPMGAEPCFVVESIPASLRLAEALGFSKKISWILTSNYHERRVEYYDARNRLLKVQDITDIRLVLSNPPRWWSMRRAMTNVQTGYRTVIVFDRVNVRTPVRDDWFTPHFLGKG